MNRIRRWKKQSSGKNLLFAVAALVILMVPMQATCAKLQQDGLTMMDFMIGYDADDVYFILNAIGQNGRSTYLILIGLDLCLGLIYTAVLFLAIAMLLKKNLAPDKWDRLLFLPVIAMAFDYIENLFTFINIQTFPTINAAVTFTECCGTILKYTFLILSVIAVVILLIRSLLKKQAEI